jgi:hypothetical protein
MVSRKYPTYAWYAAMAAECSCIDLAAAAYEAVCWECRGAMLPAKEPVLV